MAGEFAVKINAQEGVAEVIGSDKEWVAEQVEKALAALGPRQVRRTGERVSSGKSESRSRNGEASRGTARQPRASRCGTRMRSAINDELRSQLTRDVTDKLESYIGERESHFKKSTEQAVVIATFLLDELEWEAVGPDELYTVYSVMGWPAPNMRAALQNARNRNGYFGPQIDGKATLTRTGENFGRHGSKASA